MLPYFIAFGISIIICVFGEKFRNKSSFFSYLCYTLSVFTIAVLAALRNLDIGTDIQTYVIWEFEDAISSTSLIDFVVDKVGVMEPLYLFITYFVACFTDNVHWLLLVIGIITYGFIMAGLCKYSNIISVSIGWICFLFLFYGDTLNLIRQSIAMSIVFWGFHFVLKNSESKFWVTFLVSFLIHNSTIVFVSIYLLLKILKKRNSVLTNLGIVLCLCLVVFNYQILLELLMNIGILPIKFTRYIAYGFTYSINQVILRLPFILFILVFYKQFVFFDKSTNKGEGALYLLLLIFDLVLCQLRGILPALYRVSLYFGMFKMIAYSRIYFITNNKLFMGTVLLMFLIIVWIYQNVIQGNNEIYPYTSSLLGI